MPAKNLLKHTVKTGQAGKRADVAVAELLPEFSRSALKDIFSELVSINDQPAQASHKLQSGEVLKIDTALLNVQPPKVKLPVIYEDKDVVVIDKPAGMLTHSKGALNNEATVASFLATKITDKNLSGNRAGIVHRLDRATSGIIIGAKNAAALAYLQKQFSNRRTKKTYLAIVEGWPKPPAAIIDMPIERNPKKPQTFKTGSQGKPSQTEYRTLKEFTRKDAQYALLELRPVTGRTHQLRVHLKHISHPVVGDNVYGHAGPELLLHAKALEITLPGGQHQVFSSPTPASINNFVKP